MAVARKRPPASATLVVGVYGDGPVAAKAAQALLDHRYADKDVKFILTTVPEGIPSASHHVYTYAPEGFELVLDPDTDKMDGAWIDEASVVHRNAPKVTTRLLNLLKTAQEEGDEVEIVLAWDDTDETYGLLEAGIAAGISSYDLCDGLELIEITEDEPEASTEVDDEEAEVEVPVDERKWPFDTLPLTEKEARKKGVRFLRDLIDENTDLGRRKVGAMDLDQCLEFLFDGGEKTAAEKDAEEIAEEAGEIPFRTATDEETKTVLNRLSEALNDDRSDEEIQAAIDAEVADEAQSMRIPFRLDKEKVDLTAPGEQGMGRTQADLDAARQEIDDMRAGVFRDGPLVLDLRIDLSKLADQIAAKVLAGMQ